jgi:hypothetical protein
LKIVIQIRAEKTPKTDQEKRFMAEILTNGKLEEWRKNAETELREALQFELDLPDALDVSITVVEDDQNQCARA